MLGIRYEGDCRYSKFLPDLLGDRWRKPWQITGEFVQETLSEWHIG